MNIRTLEKSTKQALKGDIVALVGAPELITDLPNALVTKSAKNIYEKTIVAHKQHLGIFGQVCFVGRCISPAISMVDFKIIDIKHTIEDRDVYVLQHKPEKKGDPEYIVLVHRENFTFVKYKTVIYKKEAFYKKTADGRDLTIIVDQERGLKVKVTRDANDKFDAEKAVLYALVKAGEKYSHEEVLVFIEQLKTSYACAQGRNKQPVPPEVSGTTGGKSDAE